MKHYRKRMNLCYAILEAQWLLYGIFKDNPNYETFLKTDGAKKWLAYFYFYMYEIIMKGEPQEGNGLIGVSYGVSPLKAKDEI